MDAARNEDIMLGMQSESESQDIKLGTQSEPKSQDITLSMEDESKSQVSQDSVIMDAGALSQGEEVNIYSFRNVGFLLQYFAVGTIYGGLPSTIYGLFLGYLNVPGYVYATAGVITTLPWSLKFVFGLLNDCLPIRGYRRKPDMVIGWAVCAGVLICLSQVALPEPYYCRDERGSYDRIAQPCNKAASEAGGPIAMLMCLASLGYVIADVAADGLMVEYARREPASRRGTTQTTIYMVRSLGMFCAVMLVGLGMNGKEYNGTFNWSLSFPQVCGILAIPAGMMIPCSWFLVREEPLEHGERQHLSTYLRGAWDLLTSRAFFFVVMYQFWEPFIGRISTTAGGLVKKEWAGVQVLQQQIFTLVSLCCFSFGLYQVKRRLLHCSWRKMLFVSTILINVVDSFFSFLTIFDVVRNQYFYLGETILDDIPAATNFVVSTFIIVEMAEEGNEGLVYGLLTTISNLGTPFSRAVGNQIFSLFDPDLSAAANYVADTPSFRKTVALSFGVSYAFSFVSMLCLFFLPSQKTEAQRRRKEWPKHPAYGVITLSLLFVALCYSLTVNFMTMVPTTACLKFVGGPGCEESE